MRRGSEAEAKRRRATLVKYVPLGHRNTPHGRFSRPNHRKTRALRDVEEQKTSKNELGNASAVFYEGKVSIYVI